MNLYRLTTIALAGTLALSTHAPATAVDRLYKRDIDRAATDIVWGNRAEPNHRREVLAIDPPLPRIGPDEPPVEVLAFFRYDIGRTNRGPLKEWMRNANNLLDRWQTSLPPEVNVIRAPIAVPELPGGAWRWSWEFAARTHLRMLLAGRALGIEHEVHESLLATLDVDQHAFGFPTRRGVRAAPENISGLRDQARMHFRTKLGIEQGRFDEAWDSTTVENAMTKSITAHEHVWMTSDRRDPRGTPYRRTVPPIFLINGKHIVGKYNVKRSTRVFQLANEFIARELAAAPTGDEQDTRWKTLYEELRLVRPQQIGHGQTLAPAPGQVIELDPPLPTNSPPGTIEINWFFTYLHRGHDGTRITGWLTGRMENLLALWAQTYPADELARTTARYTVVTELPGHPGTTAKHARMLQELALGWSYSEEVAPSELRASHISFPIHLAIRSKFGYYTPPETLDSRREISRLLRGAKIRMANYRRTKADGSPKRRADASNTRFATLMERAERASPGAFRAPAYPIFLIDGKYLITGALAGSYTNAARITNHIVQKLLAERRE